MRQAEEGRKVAVGIPATMRALQQTSLKGPQDMRLITDAAVPSPCQGEVLIRVAAAGVNFADISRAYGTFLGGPQPPYLAGFEAAGEVVAVGEAVTGPRSGTRVVGVGYGAFAEYMVLSAAAAVPELAHRTCRAQAPGPHRQRGDGVGPRCGGRDRPGRGDDGQALRRDGHRHRLAEQARDSAGTRR
jgi:Alcohol dehydrogenase GroES-like domain